MLASLRAQAFTWVGVIGAAITLFGNFKTILELSQWARWLMENWAQLIGGLWGWLGSLVHISIPRDWAIYLTLCLFLLSVSVGARLYEGQDDRNPVYVIVRWIAGFIGGVLAFLFLLTALASAKVIGPVQFNETDTALILFMGLAAAQMAAGYRDGFLVRSVYAITIGAMFAVAAFAFFRNIKHLGTDNLFAISVLAISPFVVPSLIAKPSAFAKRSALILAGLLFLLGLNYLAGIEPSFTPPR